MLESHRLQPEISLEKHVRKKRIELGAAVNSLYRVYLDLRFWILIRDSYLSKDKNKPISLLLDQLLSLVQSGKAVCPISESVFVELLKQDDPVSRATTAKLIDELSLGVTLIVHPERVQQELCNTLYENSGAKNLIPAEQLVWTKLSSVFGEVHPSETVFEPTEELVIQKAFYDHMWEVSLVEMVTLLDPTSMPTKDWNATAKRLNEGNKKHEAEINSYRKAYRFEFEGSLSVFRQEMLALFQEIKEAGYSFINNKFNHLSESARFSVFSKSIPTLHIGASCHAAVRWDKTRKLTGNDLFDFHHAEAALGYCNLFLTEKPLKSLLSQNHLGLKENFACKIITSVAEALEITNEVNS